MSQRYRVEKAIDPAIGRRMLSTCWLLAGLGSSVFQMLLLAQTWSLRQQAFVPACMASAWVLGALFGMRVRIDSRLGGSCLVCCVLLWLVSWQVTLLPITVVHLCTLAALALLLGAISTAWLSQRRLLGVACLGRTARADLCDAAAGVRCSVCQPCSSS